jgi:hypothetical protein
VIILIFQRRFFGEKIYESSNDGDAKETSASYTEKGDGDSTVQHPQDPATQA